MPQIHRLNLKKSKCAAVPHVRDMAKTYHPDGGQEELLICESVANLNK